MTFVLEQHNLMSLINICYNKCQIDSGIVYCDDIFHVITINLLLS
jgi:hypothetical protein